MTLCAPQFYHQHDKAGNIECINWHFRLHSTLIVPCTPWYCQRSNGGADSMGISDIVCWLGWACDRDWCQYVRSRCHKMQVIYHLFLCCLDIILSEFFSLRIITLFRRRHWWVGRPFSWWLRVWLVSVWIHPGKKKLLPEFQMRVFFLVFFNFVLPFVEYISINN